MKILKKGSLLVIVMLLVTVLLIGCSSEEEKYLNIVGSTSVTPVATELAEKFMEINENVKIDVQGIGSSAGVKAAYDKTADIGMSSRNLKETEKTWGLKEVIIAYDGIAISVNPANPIDELTTEQAKDIFEGKITNWKQVGGIDKEIIVISREAGSGTRGAFEDLIGLVAEDKDGNKYSTLYDDALIAEGNGAVKANVASKENSIGYLSLAYGDDTVKLLKIDGNDPTVENIKLGNYKISRPFLMLLVDDENELANKFIDFILSDEGQEIVGEKLITIE